ncbi:MAG: hypothetical protein [Chaetfec virus UA24_244]|nr:MAG: hypothetical protein [Chaetfec virus UA24_244]
MKDVGIVHGSAEQAVPLVIGKDTVYVHTDIRPSTETDPLTGKPRSDFVYHEVQYDKDEYLQMMAQQAEENNDLVNTILGVSET